MSRSLGLALVTLFCLTLAGLVVAAPPTVTGSGPLPISVPGTLKISGAVKSERTLVPADLAAFPLRSELAKHGPSTAEYGGSLEWRGFDLAEAVGRDTVQKKEEDGFNRELDLYLVATGENGRKVWLSYGEVFLGPRGGFLVGTGYRHLIPHKHPDLAPMSWDPAAWLTGAASDKTTVKDKGCLSCHGANKPPAIDLPATPCLVAIRDGWPGRFLPGLTSVEIRPVPPALRTPVAAQPKDTMFATAPRLLLPDGTVQELTGPALATWPRIQLNGATFGLGKGFHGIHSYQGISLAALLDPLIKPADRPRLGVLAVSPDGYRVLLSGGEIFGGRPSDILLVEKEDGQNLGPGNGAWKLVTAADFYVDRSVRTLAELRCFLFPEP